MSPFSNEKSPWESYYDAIKRQNWQDALSALKNILQVKSGSYQVYLKMGDLLQRLQDIKTAVNAYHTAAVLVIKDGFLLKAIGIYKIILRLDPVNDEARMKLDRVMNLLSSAKKGLTVYKGQLTSDLHNHSEEINTLPAGSVDEERESLKLPTTPTDSYSEGTGILDEGDFTFPGIHVQSNASPIDTLAATPSTEDILISKISSDLPSSSGLNEFSQAAEMNLLEQKSETASMDTMAFTVNQDVISEYEDFDAFLREVASESKLFAPDSAASDGCPVCFRPLGLSRANKFIANAPVISKKAGDRIFNEGNYGKALYLLKSGTVKLTVHIYTTEMVLTTLKKDDLFGELTFLTGRTLTTSAVADTDCTIAEFNQILMVEAIVENPSIIECLNDLYLSRFSDTLSRLPES